MSGTNMLNRANLQPRLVRLISGLALHQVEEAVGLLLDYVDAGQRVTQGTADTTRHREVAGTWGAAEALKSIISAFDSGSSMRDDMLGHAIDSARPLLASSTPAASDAAALAERLHAAYSASTAGAWCRGVGTHQIVAKVAGRPESRIAEFRHADDAHFCDVMHELAPAIIRELRAQQAQQDARRAGA